MLLCSIRTFCPFCTLLTNIPSSPSFRLTHADTHTHTQTHSPSPRYRASPGESGRFMRRSWVRQAPSFPPGGVTTAFVCQGSSRWRTIKKPKKTSPLESEDSYIQDLLSSSRISRAAAIKQNEIFGVKLVAIFQIFISAGLMKMH